jgi:hypothetical protein
MAKKQTLLTEATVRRFMKLAELGPLASPFLENYNAYNNPLAEEEESREERADVDRYEYEEGEEAVEAEAGEDLDADLDLDGEEPAGDETEEMVRDLVSKLADAIRDATGVDVSVESEGETEEVESMDMDEELPELGMDVDLEAETEVEVEEEDPLAELQQYGGNKGDESKTHKGEKDYTTKKGEEIKTGRTKGQKAYEGPSKGERSKTHKGEEDYTAKKGSKSKTHAGKDYEDLEEANIQVIDDDFLVQEVAYRVAQRLLGKNK